MYLIIINIDNEYCDVITDIPDKIKETINGIIYKQITSDEMFSIIKWLLENNITYYNIHVDDQTEYLFMLENEAMKFKLRWI